MGDDPAPLVYTDETSPSHFFFPDITFFSRHFFFPHCEIKKMILTSFLNYKNSTVEKGNKKYMY